MKRYLAYSAGPIFQTISQARSTKALWASSYLFSWITREVMRRLEVWSGATNNIEFLNVFRNNPDIYKDNLGAGLFPDRFVARINGKAVPDLQEIVQDVIRVLSVKLSKDLSNPTLRPPHSRKRKSLPVEACTEEAVSKWLTQYLRLLALYIELPESETNPVKTVDEYLNSLELASTRVATEQIDFPDIIFEDLYYSFLIRNGYNAPDFPSTPEIATSAFAASMGEQEYNRFRSILDDIHTPEEERQEKFITSLAMAAGGEFRLCHKYIAIVRADGDNMGYLFQSRNDQERTQLANCLADFSLAACRKVRDFGGVAVYAGGDDLLFVAPVNSLVKTDADYQQETIFHLIEQLDKLFVEKVLRASGVTAEEEKHLIAAGKKPALSYGISVSHHKYPLRETLETAQENLFVKIKSGDARNSIAWNLTKHSGSGFSSIFNKASPVYTSFHDLLNTHLPGKSVDALFLSSVIFRLESLEGLFRASTASQERNQCFHDILFNNFNERIHRGEDGLLSPFLGSVLRLLIACFDELPLSEDIQTEQIRSISDKCLKKVYSCLRFVHFINTAPKS